MSNLRAAVVGLGMMGRNHARILRTMPGIDLLAVVDPDDSQGVGSHEHRCRDIDELPDVDIAVVATPTHTHADVASQLLERGVHTLVEKPLASTAVEAEHVAQLAEKLGLVLAVGHVERFNAAFGVLKSLCKEPRLLSFERLSPFTPRIGDTVVMDLMVHDLDLALWILGEYPEHVQAAGARVWSDAIDVASAILKFPSGAVASLQCSRATQDKVRRVAISERERFILADSIRQDVLVKRETTVAFSEHDGAQSYRQANVVEIPYLDRLGEPLARELQDFVAAVTSRGRALVSGSDGAAAVRLAGEIDAQIDRVDRLHG